MEATKDLERLFDAAMMDIYRRALSEVNYKAIRFLQMLNDHRGVETALILLGANSVSDGYTALWEHGRLDLTVEALIYDNPEYHLLFEPNDIEIARKRLEEYEYFKGEY